MNRGMKVILKIIGCLGALVLALVGCVYLFFGSLGTSSDSQPSWKSELPATATEIRESGFAEGFIPSVSRWGELVVLEFTADG